MYFCIIALQIDLSSEYFSMCPNMKLRLFPINTSVIFPLAILIAKSCVKYAFISFAIW